MPFTGLRSAQLARVIDEVFARAAPLTGAVPVHGPEVVLFEGVHAAPQAAPVAAPVAPMALVVPPPGLHAPVSASPVHVPVPVPSLQRALAQAGDSRTSSRAGVRQR